MKIVFLDIDGVMATDRAVITEGNTLDIRYSLDEAAVTMIGRLAEVDPSLRFVISSDWREVLPREELYERLRAKGFVGQFHDDWRTPSIRSAEVTKWCADNPKARYAERGIEVSVWLARHSDVTGYICIDDRKPKFSRSPHLLVHVKVPEDGFSVRNFHEACSMLFGDAKAWHKANRQMLLRQESFPDPAGAFVAGDQLLRRNAL